MSKRELQLRLKDDLQPPTPRAFLSTQHPPTDMWLINVENLQLEWFNTSACPSYSILSHTWGKEEVSFQQFQDPDARREIEDTPQLRKIVNCCRQSEKDGYQYTWIDTCCIDKTNSAELSEAINSMFKWYNRAAICYVYLSDFGTKAERYLEEGTLDHLSMADKTTLRDDLAASAWFWRGWTLQELVAPSEIYFFDRAWCFVATRAKIAGILSDITGIDTSVLQWPEQARIVEEGSTPLDDENAELSSKANAFRQPTPRTRRFEPSYGTSSLGALRGHLDRYTIAQRMSWAANRETTRIEDRAYSLLGIFDISLPLVYGEGSKAFLRLQEEIMKSSTDHSILAWNYVESSVGSFTQLKDSGQKYGWLLAPSPNFFSGASKIVYYRTTKETEGLSFEMTNLGLRITLPVVESRAVLNCAMSNNLTGPLALCLAPGVPVGHYVDNKSTAANSRVLYSSRLAVVPREELQSARLRSLILLREVTAPKEDLALRETGFRIRGNHPGFKVHVVDSVPEEYGFGGEASKYAISLPFAKEYPDIAALRLELEMVSESLPNGPSGKLDIVFGVDAHNIESPPRLWANSAPYVRAFRSNDNKLSTRLLATRSSILDAKKNFSWKIQQHASLPLSQEFSLDISIRKENAMLWCVDISASRTSGEGSSQRVRHTVVDDVEDSERKQRSIKQRRMRLCGFVSMVVVWLVLGLIFYVLTIMNRNSRGHAPIASSRPGL